MVIKFTILGGARTPHWRNTQQQASTSINKHQHSHASTSISKHQQESISINKHQQASTSINNHQQASLIQQASTSIQQASTTTSICPWPSRFCSVMMNAAALLLFSLAFAAKRRLKIKGSDCRGGGLNVLSTKTQQGKKKH